MTAPRRPPAGITFKIPPELRVVVDEVRSFIEHEVVPLEAELDHDADLHAHWHLVDTLRQKARHRGIFAPQLPEEFGGRGLSTIGVALVSEACGASALAPWALNIMAPDEGNIHLLLRAGTEEQRERWLRPLATGQIRSCFLMTEPNVASSDPLALETTARLEDGTIVLNGCKAFATGAVGATFGIVVARTGPSELGAKAYSLIIVPTDTRGWTIVRDPDILGPHFPGGHPQVSLRDVRVPACNLIGERGQGFALAQLRLGAGRLGHAMRWIGTSQRALDLAAERMLARSVQGRPLAEHQQMQVFLADSAIELYAARLMVLHAAWTLDEGGDARQEVAMVKTFVSEAFGRIIDRAVQVFGGAGVSHDHPLAQWYMDARAARIFDGASEVHRVAIAKRMLSVARKTGSTRTACGTA